MFSLRVKLFQYTTTPQSSDCAKCVCTELPTNKVKASSMRNNLTAICFLIKICGEHNTKSAVSLQQSASFLLCLVSPVPKEADALPDVQLHPFPTFSRLAHSGKIPARRRERPPTTATRRINLLRTSSTPFTSSAQRKSIQRTRFHL